jgi:glyoxylase-like metal-dependent hydrolase (beta-lactamase superfamily II)
MAGAALGLDRSLAIAAPTRVQQTPHPTQGFFRYKIGDAECTALYDGIWEKAHDPAFFSNATVAETKEALAAAGFTAAFVTIPITVFIIKLNDKLVMCDAGGGEQVQAFNPQSIFVSGRLMANMKAAGIDPKKIETILVSHFHPDHIFGLLEKETNAPVFPNAEIIVPAAEYRWWTDPSIITRLPKGRRPLARRIQTVIPKWKNVLPVEGEDEVVPGIRFVSAPGHTPGHTAFHVSSGNEQLMISSDAAYVPALWRGIRGGTGSSTRMQRWPRPAAASCLIG